MNSGKEDPKLLYKNQRRNSPDYDEFVFIDHPSDNFSENTLSKQLATTNVEIVEFRQTMMGNQLIDREDIKDSVQNPQQNIYEQIAAQRRSSSK